MSPLRGVFDGSKCASLKRISRDDRLVSRALDEPVLKGKKRYMRSNYGQAMQWTSSAVCLRRRPRYFECIIMYAWHISRGLVGRSPEAELLISVRIRCFITIIWIHLYTSLALLACELFGLIRPLNTSAARAAVCSTVWSERYILPLTVIMPRGPGILSSK